MYSVTYCYYTGSTVRNYSLLNKVRIKNCQRQRTVGFQIILLVGIILLVKIFNLWVVRSASVNLHFVNSVVCGGDDGGGEDIGDVVGHVHGSVIHD